MPTGKNGSLRLSDVNDRLDETVQDTVSWQASLRAAMFNAIGPDDVAEIVQKQVQLAKEGKESAAKFVLTHVVGSNTPVRITQTNVITDVETAAKLARNAG